MQMSKRIGENENETAKGGVNRAVTRTVKEINKHQQNLACLRNIRNAIHLLLSVFI